MEEIYMNKQKIREYFNNEISIIDNQIRLLNPNDRDSYRNLLSKKAEFESDMQHYLNFSVGFEDYLRDKRLRDGAEKFKDKYPLNFIDNYIFILPNKDKKFTDKEIIALIIRNPQMSLNEKFKALCEIKNKDLMEDINKWIDYKKYCVDFISKLNNPNFSFIISDTNYLFSNLNEALTMNKLMAISYGISIPSKKGEIASIVFSEKNSESNELLDLISEITVAKDAFNGFNYYMSPLYRLTIELKTPFKKFDYILLPDSIGFLSHVVVRDDKKPKLSSLNMKDLLQL